jgi:integrase/recombinase XerC
MPRHLLSKTKPLPAPVRPASEILSDYEHWLLANYGAVGTYLNHAKSFLRRFRAKGSLLSQLDTFASKKSITGRSILNRFKRFLEEKAINSVENDLTASNPLPLSNIYIKLFLLLNSDRLKSRTTRATYATILNGYFEKIGDLRHFEKVTAQRYIFDKNFSDFTSSLYASVLRSFANWALSFVTTPDRQLSLEQRKIKEGLKRASQRSLRDVVSIKATATTSKLYHKESLTHAQRERLLKACTSHEQRAIVSLMAWNGLRPIEVLRLRVGDIDFRSRKIAIQGKGSSAKSKIPIVLFKVCFRELKVYLREPKSDKEKLFPGLHYKLLRSQVTALFKKIKLSSQGEKLSPHSLRHTAGQLLYNTGVPLEFIQRTLRHRSMQSTMVYANKAIEHNYFKKMKAY